MKELLPWVMSAITIYTMWAAGEKRKNTWIVGLANQILWVIFIVMTEAWGLLPMTAAIVFVYARNHIKWRAEETKDSKGHQGKSE